MILLGVDPGRSKFGWAFVSEEGTLLFAGITPTAVREAWRTEIQERRWRGLIPWSTEGDPEAVCSFPAHFVLGNGTARHPFQILLEENGWPVTLVEERNSTLEARELHALLHPPRGWRRIFPPSLFPPSRDLDDLAAWSLTRRFLGTCPRGGG